MATEAQQDFFYNLTGERDFGPNANIDALRQEFATLTDKSASKWIERALELPEKGEVAPKF